jgi:serine/threonine protein kinase/WD40 repeat protein
LDPSPSSPKTIGKFEILDRLGQGGMGTVYRARDPGLDRLVALKTIVREAIDSEEAKERFFREARAAARLQHPNIVTVYEAGDCEGTLYIAMELLDGQDLGRVLHAPRGVEDKVRIVVEICRGLDYAHKRGVIHRDIKPANIRLLPEGGVKILDFGIARLGDAHMTQTGLVVGTPSYVSPEALTSGRVDHRADQWAVGIVLYEFLSGRRPFASPNFANLAHQIVHDPLPPLDPLALGLPAGLSEVLSRCLAKTPGDRYPDLGHLAVDLRKVAGLRVPVESPLSDESRRKSYQESIEEANRRLAAHDLERALEAARRAQAVEPSGREVLVLLEGIEARLSGHASAPVPAFILARLGSLGAAAYRDLGTFGEPPPTQTSAFSKARQVLALAGTDGAIRLWDVAARRRLVVLRTQMHQRAGHDARPVCLAFSADGKLLVSGHVDGAIHVFDLSRGVELPLKLRHEEMVSSLAFSPDGKTLVSGGTDTNLKLWEVRGFWDGESRRELYRQPSPITALAYLADGRKLVTAHTNRTLRLVDAATTRLIATLRGPEAPVTLVRPDPSGRRLVAASQDRLLRIFDLETSAAPASLPPFRKPLTAACFFPDGRHIATVGLENVVQIWDLEARTVLASLYGGADEAFAGVVLYGTEHLGVALADGRIRLWGPA